MSELKIPPRKELAKLYQCPVRKRNGKHKYVTWCDCDCPDCPNCGD